MLTLAGRVSVIRSALLRSDRPLETWKKSHDLLKMPKRKSDTKESTGTPAKGPKLEKEEKTVPEQPGPSEDEGKQFKFEGYKTTTPDGKEFNRKILLWNVAGLKAFVKKGCLDALRAEDADIVCLQETKCDEKVLPEEVNRFKNGGTIAFEKKENEGYHMYWASAVKKGYSGVSLWSKVEPLNVSFGIGFKEFDDEGRSITAEYDEFYLVTTYVPNSGRKLVRLAPRQEWDKALREYVNGLDKEKPVILCGDMNVAHEEIDLANPKTNKKNAGFTNEEREGFTQLLDSGFTDTFRHLNPGVKGAYSFWTFMGNARERNIGWRLDYFLCSNRVLPNVCDSTILQQRTGSDHCPLVLLLAV